MMRIPVERSSKPLFLTSERCAAAIKVSLFLLVTFFGVDANCQVAQVLTCDRKGIGSVQLSVDKQASIQSVSNGSVNSKGADIPYCLVKVHVPRAINIWVGLPMGGRWNGRLESEGGGGYGGVVRTPIYSILRGYAGVQTDTGHIYKPGESGSGGGAFGMLSPGIPDVSAQEDFAYRSQHLMALVGKQLAVAFYGTSPRYAYWNGCSEGGREGLAMAQDFPGDYDGILAGAPAINWDKAAAYELWPQLLMKAINNGVISSSKLKLANDSAIRACDAMDGINDGIITDSRNCHYKVFSDKHITRESCTAAIDTCLTPKEALIIDLMWQGPTDSMGTILYPAIERGAPLSYLAGSEPSGFALDQARYWVYFDPLWDWHSLTLDNYYDFFKQSVRLVHPTLSNTNGDLSKFRTRGGKLLLWHGLSDPLIVPRSTINYYESVANASHLKADKVPDFVRLFLAPGVEHCGGGNAPLPGRRADDDSWLAIQENLFDALVSWVEQGQPPDSVEASQLMTDGKLRRRPLCPHPSFAQYINRGSGDEVSSFTCSASKLANESNSIRSNVVATVVKPR